MNNSHDEIEIINFWTQHTAYLDSNIQSTFYPPECIEAAPPTANHMPSETSPEISNGSNSPSKVFLACAVTGSWFVDFGPNTACTYSHWSQYLSQCPKEPVWNENEDELSQWNEALNYLVLSVTHSRVPINSMVNKISMILLVSSSYFFSFEARKWLVNSWWEILMTRGGTKSQNILNKFIWSIRHKWSSIPVDM